MEIYKNRIHIGTIPGKIRRKGYIRTRLSGLNLLQTPERTELQAVYRSTLGCTRSGGVRIIDIVLGQHILTALLSRRYPFITLTKGDPITFEDEL